MASLAETNGTPGGRGRRIAGLFAPLLGLSLLGAAAGLYVHDTELYYKALTWLGIDPFRHPFVDGEYILAAIKCWRQGTDVFIANSCDVLARPFAYSPLWLRLPPVPMSWATPIGLATAIAFFLSLSCLSPPRCGIGLALTLLATLSTATVFAVERANADLIIFLLVVMAGILSLRASPGRLLSYPVIVLAGLLKFYPI